MISLCVLHLLLNANIHSACLLCIFYIYYHYVVNKVLCVNSYMYRVPDR